MALSTQGLIDLIDEKIEALINSPEVDYKIGDKSVSAGQKMKQLKDMRASLLSSPDADIKTLEIEGFDVDEFGVTE